MAAEAELVVPVRAHLAFRPEARRALQTKPAEAAVRSLFDSLHGAVLQLDDGLTLYGPIQNSRYVTQP